MRRLRGRFKRTKLWRLDYQRVPDPFAPTLYLLWIGPFKGVFWIGTKNWKFDQ